MQLLRIDWNVIFTIVNLIVLYLGLRKFLIGPVTKVMDQRKQLIEGQMADARHVNEQANELKAQYEDALKQAHEESAQIVEKARKSAQAEYESRMDAADAEAQKIIANAHKLSVRKPCRSCSRRLRDLPWRQPLRYWATRIRQRRTSLCMNSFWRKRVV